MIGVQKPIITLLTFTFHYGVTLIVNLDYQAGLEEEFTFHYGVTLIISSSVFSANKDFIYIPLWCYFNRR